jgi:hypothetical protein
MARPEWRYSPLHFNISITRILLSRYSRKLLSQRVGQRAVDAPNQLLVALDREFARAEMLRRFFLSIDLIAEVFLQIFNRSKKMEFSNLRSAL